MATSSKIVFDRDELDLIVLAGCSLDESPGSNWVQENGGLPDYICRIAKAIKRTGKTTSQAVAIAVSRVKKWAAGADDVDADTRAKAAAALAEWEKLKAKNKAKKTVKATGQGDFLCLTTNFNVDAVRKAWNQQTSDWRIRWRTDNPTASYSEGPPYSYIKEMWTTYLIVECDNGDELHKVDYEVDDDGEVTFAEPVPVKTQYVVIDDAAEKEIFGDQPTNSQLRQLLATMGPCRSKTDTLLLSIKRSRSALEEIGLAGAGARTALETVLAAAKPKE